MTPKIGISGILMHKGKILLGQRGPGESSPGMWCTPGGGVEPRETLNGALVREFIEEVSLHVHVLEHFVSIQEIIKPARHVVVIFKQVHLGLDRTIKPKPSAELPVVKWLSADQIWQLDAARLITPSTINALAEFLRK